MDSHFLLQGIFQTRGIKHLFPASAALAGGFFTASATWSHFKMLFPAVHQNDSDMSARSAQSLSNLWLFAIPWTVCSPPGSSVHGILQARVLEWVAIAFSGVRGNRVQRYRFRSHWCEDVIKAVGVDAVLWENAERKKRKRSDSDKALGFQYLENN